MGSGWGSGWVQAPSFPAGPGACQTLSCGAYFPPCSSGGTSRDLVWMWDQKLPAAGWPKPPHTHPHSSSGPASSRARTSHPGTRSSYTFCLSTPERPRPNLSAKLHLRDAGQPGPGQALSGVPVCPWASALPSVPPGASGVGAQPGLLHLLGGASAACLWGGLPRAVCTEPQVGEGCLCLGSR